MNQNIIYNINPYCFRRILTREVKVGHLSIGGESPVRVQSMTNTSTRDVVSTTNQAEQIIKAGGELVRFSVANKKEIESLRQIKKELRQRGYQTPLVADTHFNADVARMAAEIVEKVRINPGNYYRSNKDTYSQEEYKQELKKTEEKLLLLIETCKKHNTALRIGSNHGSLSSRIIFQYGDTPEGMVHSALEYVDICKKHNFFDIILSMKSSNTRVMVQTYRLLMHRMIKSGDVFPLHLGVTEAGHGEDGRIKSAVGIGALLLDGLGDTIRVSLTENPDLEIPVAEKLRNIALDRFASETQDIDSLPFDPFEYRRRKTYDVAGVGDNNPLVVTGRDAMFEYYLKKNALYRSDGEKLQVKVVEINDAQDLDIALAIKEDKLIFLHAESVQQARSLINRLNQAEDFSPVLLRIKSQITNKEDLTIEMASLAGTFLVDGLVDGLMIENDNFSSAALYELSCNILQASRARIFKTEFISCPGCGRTLFDLQTTAEHIRKSLGHLKGLKIGIMGCIVNGPGEMADADYGYVGAAKGKVNLYKNKEIIKSGVPEDKALEELINLIKFYGDWKEPG
ncbi:MAG: (E)-4-hydroxy-3-methylbut-2-enyl-diphosphate synthase [Bacteroidales bacterium]|nr:(E)-4-hydroxy-3-methylbut-2-enyl-diphosphate synthase [Bacteroidales bacterium]MCF8326875.1 (E)-4-hydroxy-3-methylbut-2-enyl-diphosphate synthase [Bacteroidales bacterium]MCF8339321.1 (E)-4-hydroxy-3-methylbut-2-enyl-diphosphate synthase [Bacteroidales bacterium]